MTKTGSLPPRLKHIHHLAKLMDTQFRISGTSIRFGLDALIGLIPGVGDLSTFAVSGYMLLLMAQNGAGGYVMARMVMNILIDTIIGMIPLIGDLFDIGFKANIRNMRLMQQYYTEGRHRGGAWKIVVPVLFILFLVILGLIWLTWKLVAWLISYF